MRRTAVLVVSALFLLQGNSAWADDGFGLNARELEPVSRFKMCRNDELKNEGALSMRRKKGKKARSGEVVGGEAGRGERQEKGDVTNSRKNEIGGLDGEEISQDATRIGTRTIHNLTFGIRDTYVDPWAPPITFSWISAHPTNPDVAYAATANGFLYRTTDGGRYWQETRLIASQSNFFGAIRQDGAVLGVGIKGAARRLQAQTRAYWGRQTKAWQDYPYAYPYATRGTSIGVVRSPLDITPGSINMKQFLVMRSGSRSRIPTRINHIAFDPNDEKVAFAATAYGVFKTEDSGLSWHEVFFGGNEKETDTIWVAVHPKDGNRVFLGTLGGLFVSNDGGMSWDKDFRTPLGGARVLKIEFFKRDPDIMYAGTSTGLWKSTDGGRNWTWIYGLRESGFREAFVIERLAVSSVNPDLVYIGTQDGLFRTTDGGDTWETIQEGLFGRRFVRGLVVSPLSDNHIYMAVEEDLYESIDSGKTWNKLFVPTGQWWINEIALSEKSPEDLWILTDRVIMRMSPFRESGSTDQTGGSEAGLDAKEIPPLPPVGRVLDKAFRHANVHQAQLSRKRRKARLRNFLPLVDISYSYKTDNYARNARLAKWRYTGMDPWLYEIFMNQNHVFSVMFRWDLAKILHDPDTLQFGRVAVQARWVRRNIQDKVLMLYDEGSRLRELMINSPPDDELLRITYENRLREIYSLLSIQTGNFVSDWQDDG